MDDVRGIVRRALSAETRAEFDRRVAEQADTLRAAISEGAYDSSGFALGLECECYAVDGEDRLRRLPERLFDAPRRTREIGRHNIELNSTPQPFDAEGTAAHAAELRAAVDDLRADADAGDADCRIVTDGMWTIPPTEGSRAYFGAVERDDDIVVADNMHVKPRYCAIDNALLEHAGGSIPLSVPGAEESFPTILVESLTTSIQPHLQIPDTEQFPRYFNAAIRTMGPVLALATNSPFLPGDLYTDVDDPERLVDDTPHELRVPVFEETVNSAGYTKAGCPSDIDDPADIVDRVVGDWTCGPFLSEWEVDADDEPDPYWEFRHKYGTYWRWVRSIVGGDASEEGTAGETAADSPGGGALRIEYRPLPTQPTVDDILALHWLVVGLLRGVVAADHPLTELPWADARDSFYNAVDDGLDAELHWMTADGEVTTDHDVLYEEVFALAERGLRAQGLREDAAAECIAPMRARWKQETTPSQWKKDRVRRELDDGASLAEAITTMQREYNRLSRQGESFDEW